VPEGFVKLVRADLTYEIVKVGHDAEGEGDDCGDE
jgi:hypothetical protein